MEFLTKRVVFMSANSKSLFKGHLGYIQPRTSAVNISITCISSAAYERVEGLRNYEGNVSGQDQDYGHNLGDMAKETMDKAWDSTKNTTRNVQGTVVAAADENVVDTTEYRTIEDHLKNSEEANGHDNVGDETNHIF